jgi:hypothetical protein
MSKFRERLLFLLGAAVLCFTVFCPATLAGPADGTIQPNSCGGTATFITLPASEAKFGFADSNRAIQLTTALGAVGYAQAVVTPETLRGLPFVFQELQIVFKTNVATRRSMQVRLCMQDGDGFGRGIEPSVSFARNFTFKDLGNGWWLGRVPASVVFSGFENRKPKRAVLRLLEISLNGDNSVAQSVTIGDIRVVEALNTFRPTTLVLQDLDCLSVDCPAG